MKLSLKLRFSSLDELDVLGREADRLGFHGLWLNEPWGHDAPSLLGWLAGRTERILLGTHVASVYSRTPGAFAGVAGALQQVSGGRFRLGLGTSGPQVVEGWHGVAFRRPVGLTADVVAVVRQALRGDPVRHDGAAVTLPRPGGPGRPLRYARLGAPVEVPIYVAAMGPRNLEMVGEVADGWIPFPWSPEGADGYHDPLARGAARRDPGRGPLAVAPTCSIGFGAVDGLRRAERGNIAFYLGAMGTRDHNFYVGSVERMGHGATARAVQDAWLGGDHDRARSLVDDDLVDALAAFGTRDAVAARLDAYRAAGVDELVVELRARALDDRLDDLRTLAEIALP